MIFVVKTKNFKLVGLPSQASADSIVESTLKIVGVEEASLNYSSGDMQLSLIRENPLILKLLQYIVEKENNAIEISENCS